MEIKKITLWFGVLFLVLIIVGYLYIRVNKSLAQILNSLIALILVLRLEKVKNQRVLMAIPLLFLILFSSLSLYEEVKNRPALEITLNSIELQKLSSENYIGNFPNSLISLATISPFYYFQATEVVRNSDPSQGGEVEVANIPNASLCSSCFWYQLNIKDRGDVQFPLYLDFFSSEKISLANSEPEVSLNCGEGFYSAGRCSLKIERVAGEILKLVLYSESGDLSVVSRRENLKVVEREYRTKMISFDVLQKPNVVFYNNGKKLIFPEMQVTPSAYFLNSQGKFVPTAITTRDENNNPTTFGD